MTDFLQRLRRRKLVQWTLAYLASAWALLQVLDLVGQQFGWPPALLRSFTVVLGLGFFAVLVVAWYHGERGAQRVGRLEFGLLAAVLLLIVGAVVWLRDREAAAPATVAAYAPAHLPANAKSIAVLPFVNMSSDPDNAYFSDGVTEEILNALAQIPGLKVAARTSAFQFKGKQQDLRKVGELLDVASILEGSVQRSGDQVRITAQLIDARSGYHLWSQKYDRKLTSIFAVEDEISRAIAEQLQVTLGKDRQQPLVPQGTADPHAHELYLKGLARITGRGPGLSDAARFLKQAVALDPDYAAAWAALAQTYELLPWYDLAGWEESLARSEVAARRALALDPRLAEAHTALANVLRDRLDFAAAVEQYERALDLNPGSVETRNQYAQMLSAVGQPDAALEQERIAVGLDPLAPNPRYLLGVILATQHRYDEAIAAQQQVLARSPDYLYARFKLVLTHVFASDFAAAEREGRAAAAQAGEDPETIATLVRAVGDPSLRAAALRLLDTGNVSLNDTLGALTRASWYAQLGARDKALDQLEQWARGAGARPAEIFSDMRVLWLPSFDPIRADPRFHAVLRTLGVPYRPAQATLP